jgi:glutaredoxin
MPPAAGTKGETKGLVNPPAGMREGFAGGTSDIEVMFFNVDWCPHCTRAKEIWAPFVQKHSNDPNIKFVGGADGINCTNDKDSKIRDMIQKYNIEHFPTIYFIKDGERKEFQSNVDADKLEDFLSSL